MTKLKVLLFLFSQACLLLFLATNSKAADSTATWQQILATFKERQLAVKWLNPKIDSTLIREAEVIDFRPDTLNVGMYSNSYNKPEFLRFSDRQPLADVMKDKLSNPNNSGFSLMMIVNGFWLSGTRPVFQVRENSHKRDLFISKAVCQVDVFLKDGDKYFPLVKIDTILRSKKSVIGSGDDLITDAFEIVAFQVGEAIKNQLYLSRRKIEKQVIIDNYTKRGVAPTNTNLEKGIYRSFDQFKKRTPQAENFAVRLLKDGTMGLFIIDGKGDEIFTKNAWGVFDGTDHYIMEDGMLFKMYNEGNAFYWMGLKDYDQKSYIAPAIIPLGGGWIAYGLEPMGPNVKIKLTPKLLNTNSGQEF